jgi:acetate kinase
MSAKENKAILVINTGSSSIKYSLFSNQDKNKLSLIYNSKIENLKETDYESGLQAIFKNLENYLKNYNLTAVGHRIVHGGKDFFSPVKITPESINKISALIPLAPLHLPHEIEAIKIIAKLYPQLIQIACFDTAFHCSQANLAKLFALPQAYTDQGIIRYGFHGISYEYIASVFAEKIGNTGTGKVIVAHLGNGASMCAISQGKSVATSMGFTALEGLMMGTRCGSIDPGVILYLLQEKNLSLLEITKLLYQQSGLLGISGISSDMRELELNLNTNKNNINNKKSKLAIELFCYRASLMFGSLYAALGGCDAIVFTAGIGENSSLVRKQICDNLKCFGLEIDDNANLEHKTIISHPNSKALISIIPTNEEYMIAKHVDDMVVERPL